VFFQADFDEIELQKINYDVILVDNLQLFPTFTHFKFWKDATGSDLS